MVVVVFVEVVMTVVALVVSKVVVLLMFALIAVMKVVLVLVVICTRRGSCSLVPVCRPWEAAHQAENLLAHIFSQETYLS